MHFSRKRWRLALIGALTAIAVSVTFASPAFAAEPGEENTWHPEMVSDQTLQVETQGTLSEARNGGSLLEVWRGADNNQVWMSWNNGYPFYLGVNTATYVSPTVVPYGPDYFMVFQVGTDGSINYTVVYGDDETSGYWTQVPGQTTNMPVSVTQMGPGSWALYMVYRGAGTDTRLWGTLFNASWQFTSTIVGATSYSAPSVAWNDASQELFVVQRGTDNQAWMIGGTWGMSGITWWSGGQSYYSGNNDFYTPTIAVNSPGDMLVADIDYNNNPQYQTYDEWGNATGGWSVDVTYWQTNFVIALAAVGIAIYALITGEDSNHVYYKQAFNPT